VANKLTALLAGAALLAVTAGTADAAVYISQLAYRDGLTGAQSPSYGTVKVTEQDKFNVMVEVTLTNANSVFINTGGPHDPFLYNVNGNFGVTVFNDVAGQQFTAEPWTTPGAYTATPFGYFTSKIGCCGGEKKKGQTNGDPDPIKFKITSTSGITFAGIGAQIDASTGRVIQAGTGSDGHFFSNTLGYWFTADIFDASTGKTYNVAAKDAFGPIPPPPDPCLLPNPPSRCGGDDGGGGGQGGIPEPATWAMMILGFGGVGAVMRRRRTVFG
jgi:hypothetical protein